jgi:hypothetical protein
MIKKLDDMTGSTQAVDTTATVPLTAEDLQARIDALEAENAVLKGEFKRATDAARNSALMLSQFKEVHAGQTDPDKDGNVQDLWEYTIDLALNGGEGIKINGVWYYHNQTYTLTTDQLRTIKDIVFRTHVHEQMVFGHSKDNFYRQQSNRSITNGRILNMAG